MADWTCRACGYRHDDKSDCPLCENDACDKCLCIDCYAHGLDDNDQCECGTPNTGITFRETP